jgi:fucose permease
MLGRLVFGLLRFPLTPHQLLRRCIAGAVVGSTLLALDLGHAASFAALALLGFAIGPIFPALVATTPQRLGGAHTANAVGFQVAAAALGQSLLPTSFGVVADEWGIAVLPFLVLASALALQLLYEVLAAVAPAAGVRPPATAEAALAK